MLLKTSIVLCNSIRKVMATLKPFTGELAMTAQILKNYVWWSFLY